ncbi:interleukin-2 receptor subunit beta isoform X2 [Colossoma macropomum]|uniref:interleukin-2 receptor subunit beta isoform X2 n=1 Tax=Colossoma macropomum TaxID=42526 RepID=UPI00186551ED|nr:interleukin-2 receptor subunit beta isoform X2 [Colossoma macropomum]
MHLCLQLRTTAVMWSGWLIPVLFLSGTTWPSHALTGLSCVNDFNTNITCEWHNATQHAGQVCSLHASRNTFKGTQNERCVLQPLTFHSNGATGCWIDFKSLRFTFAEEINLKVICNGTAVFGLDNYKPGRNIKLRPLARPNVYRGNISWSKGAESSMNCEYQLQFKSASQIWEEVQPRKVDHTLVVLDSDLLTLGDEYEARVRVKPVKPENDGQYLGQWSDWSPSINWTSEVGRNKTVLDQNTQDTTIRTSGLLTGFIPVILVLLTSIIVCTVHRYYCMSKAGGEHIPDPSKYFQPLLSVHGGNFQKWLGPQHSTPSFHTPQPCDCSISPVEVSDVWDDPVASSMAHFHNNPMPSSQQTSGDSQSSSGFSNMGYFYSETQPGSVSLETCSVYFTYQPEGGSDVSLQSSSSYERLQGQDQQEGEPSSPDSGFGMGGVEEEEDDEESKEEKKEEEGRKEECSGVNIQHLVSFVLSLPESSKKITSTAATHIPLSFAQPPELSPWPEDPEVAAAGSSNTSEAPEGVVVRPSSMVVQPCSSGYLTLKEMQKYSNKSI